MQSDPHDARILKAFALGLAVATRGMDHLRNRVTLEINARINDDPGVQGAALRRAGERGAEQLRDQGARGPRLREHLRGRRLGRHVPLHDEAVQQSVAARPRGVRRADHRTSPGWTYCETELDRVGLNIMGVERLINQRLGVTRADDTLPERWFEEPITVGSYKGEKIDRAEFDAMLSRFYEVSNLTPAIGGAGSSCAGAQRAASRCSDDQRPASRRRCASTTATGSRCTSRCRRSRSSWTPSTDGSRASASSWTTPSSTSPSTTRCCCFTRGNARCRMAMSSR